MISPARSFVHRFLFLLLLLLLPTQLGFHFWPSWSLVYGIRIDYLSPTLYLTDILVAALIALEWKKIATFLFSRKALVFIFFVALNTFISISPLLTLYKWVKLTEFFLLFVTVLENKPQFLKITKTILPITLLWTAILGIFQWMHGGSLNGIFYWLGERSFTIQTPGIALSKLFGVVSLRPYATLPHPNALAGFLGAGWLYLFSVHIKSVRFWLLTSVVFFAFLLTESFGAWLSLSFVFLVALLFHITRFKTTARRLVLVQLFIVSLVSMYFVGRLIAATSLSDNTKERMELMYISALSVTQNTLTGTGLGTFIQSIPVYTDKLPAYYRARAIHLFQPVHNVPLLILSETGIIGLVLSFISVSSLPLTLPLLFIFATSLFDHYWVTLQAPLLLFAILAAFSYNSNTK